SAPVLLATRLRGGNADSRRRAASLVSRAIRLARQCGATGTLIVRGDSGFFSAEIITAIRAAGARFSVTARHSQALDAALAAIAEPAWTASTYPRPTSDPATHPWTSPAATPQR